MIRRVLLIGAVLSQAGCAAALPWAVASGGILTGIAGVTNADVNLFQTYIDWRTGSPMPAKAKVGPAAPSTPAAAN